MTEYISCDCEYKLNSTICNSNKKWNSKTCQYECKIIVHVKKVIVGILAHVFVIIISI